MSKGVKGIGWTDQSNIDLPERPSKTYNWWEDPTLVAIATFAKALYDVHPDTQESGELTPAEKVSAFQFLKGDFWRYGWRDYFESSDETLLAIIAGFEQGRFPRTSIARFADVRDGLAPFEGPDSFNEEGETRIDLREIEDYSEEVDWLESIIGE